MFSWKITAKVKTKASCKEVWKYWSNPSTWPLWDEGIEWCKLEGAFQTGTKGKLKPKGWLATRFVLTEVKEERLFSDLSKMPFTRIVFSHEVQEQGEQREITHEVSVSGLFAPFLKKTMGKDLGKGLTKTVGTLARLAEGEI